MTTVNSALSLFIPYIFPNFGKDYVKDVFETHLELGMVSHIDFVAKVDKQGQEYNAAYVHFSEWSQDENTAKFQCEVCSEKGSRIIYDDPWFWVVLENTKKKHVSGERKPRLDLSDSKSTVLPPVLKRTTNNPDDEIHSMDFPELASKCKPVQAPLPAITLQELLKMPDEFGYTEEDYKQVAELDAEIADIYGYKEEDYAQMGELEDEADASLISIDGAYVQELEIENVLLREQLQQLSGTFYQLQLAYQAEAAKSNALAKALN
jgi:hypothetical protein